MRGRRTPETQARYDKDLAENNTIGLGNEPAIIEYEYWKLVVNRYGYDADWSCHLLLVSKEECGWIELSLESVLELHELKCHFKKIFEAVLENGDTMTSVIGIPHVHLLQGAK